MKAGIAALVVAYVLSQFYRAFLAVLTPVLAKDIGAGPDTLADASGLWFLAFAAMQIPVGWMLDRIGPRLTAAGLLAVGGGGGAALFATATTAQDITLAMGLIGIGCSPVLMASYYLFARFYPPALFGTLAGATVGFGNLGNIGASIPLNWAVDAFGWRAAVLALAGITLVVALMIITLLRDPPRVVSTQKGRLVDLFRIGKLWPVLIMMAVCYAPMAVLRGLWIGPYYREVWGADAAGIAQISLWMGIAMIAGNFAYGPAERLFRTRKGVVMGGNLITFVCFAVLFLAPAHSVFLSGLLIVVIGFFGSSFPLAVAHGRAFVPAELTGRGVTLLNLFGIGSVGVTQFITGRIYTQTAEGMAFPAIFGFIAATLAIGMVVYAFSTDSRD